MTIELTEFARRRLFTRRGNGVLDMDEFRALMEELSRKSGKHIPASQVERMFRSADTDGSGELDFQEFLDVHKKKAKLRGSPLGSPAMQRDGGSPSGTQRRGNDRSSPSSLSSWSMVSKLLST